MFHSHPDVLGQHFMLCQGLHEAASVWRSEVAQRQKQIQAAPCTMRRQFLVEREHEGYMGSTVPSCRFKKSFVRRAGVSQHLEYHFGDPHLNWKLPAHGP